MELVGVEAIREAAERLRPVLIDTPLDQTRAVSARAGGEVFLKCENLQRTGSFKIRGAYNRIALLSDEERARGVVAASAGNHAQGVALGATLRDVKSTVFMPEGASLPKVEATAAYGAKVVLEGSIYDEAEEAAQRFAEETGAVMVHPFEHPDVIAGQGTLGLEILDAVPDAASLVIPIGGGGLISGIGAAVKAIRPEVKILGVEPAGAPGMSVALKAGKPADVDEISTIADGLAAKRVGELTLEHVKVLVDEVVGVGDDEIAEAVVLLAERAKLVVEPAGAVGVAAILSGKLKPPSPTVVLISGGNIDPLLMLQVIRFGMGSTGRYFSFRTRLSDRPGELHTLLGILADAGANVVGVEHFREGPKLTHLGEVAVAVQIETRGAEHVAELTELLATSGYRVEEM